MTTSFTIILLACGLFLDMLLTPLFDGTPWLPYFTLSTLPLLFLLGSRNHATAAGAVAVAYLWLFGNINLGIIIFSIGLFILFERRIVPSFLHTNTWQARAMAVLGLPLAIIIIVLLSSILPGETLTFSLRLFLGLVVSVLVALVLFKGVGKYYV